MAVDGILVSLPGTVAGADLSAAQYTFGKITGEYSVVQCSAAGEQADGVIYTNPDTVGTSVQLVVSGLVKVTAGTGGLSAGDNVATSTTGTAITAGVGNLILGVAMKDAAAGEVAEIWFPGGSQGTA